MKESIFYMFFIISNHFQAFAVHLNNSAVHQIYFQMTHIPIVSRTC